VKIEIPDDDDDENIVGSDENFDAPKKSRKPRKGNGRKK
jgi:hypothetical protein